METIPVKYPGGEYPVCWGETILPDAGRLLRAAGFGGACAVVTNPVVGGHYAQPVLKSLTDHGFQPALCEIPDGEAHKTLQTVAGLYDQFFAAGLDRKSLVLSLGGGVVGDQAGFAAATYLRGVPFVQIPTSLLAMVDAGVGGKTGVDLPQGKNLVGAFKQPRMVIVDAATLATLPGPEFRSGLAEALKHGIIADPALFEAMQQGALPLPKMIAAAIQVKVDIVQADPFERGRRAVLNLGHTFGHAFEKLSGFQLRHGEGVAIGMACAARLAANLGHCAPAVADQIISAIDFLGLPTALPDHEPVAVWQAMGADKKKEAGQLRFILPTAIGQVDIFTDVPQAAVIEVLTK